MPSVDVRPVRSRADLNRRDRIIAASIASTPLLIPYYLDYDLLLLAAVAGGLIARCLRREKGQDQSAAEAAPATPPAPLARAA